MSAGLNILVISYVQCSLTQSVLLIIDPLPHPQHISFRESGIGGHRDTVCLVHCGLTGV